MAQLELVHPIERGASHSAHSRADFRTIALMVRENAKVLDIGCGDGALMSLLRREIGASVRGLDINQGRVHACVTRGLSVVQGDADQDLSDFPAGAFDYVILSHTLQSLRQPRTALRHAARIGERVIISITNVGHWRARLHLLRRGRMPGPLLQAEFPCSVRDFAALVSEARLHIERAVPLSRGHAGAPFAKTLWRANWFAEEAVFLLSS
jgi:methionine biosynthesis protein MetW